jgi:hypothetical protein
LRERHKDLFVREARKLLTIVRAMMLTGERFNEQTLSATEDAAEA